MEQQPSVQSLERAFALLEALAREPGGLPLSELTRLTGLHKSTVHRLLASLSALGYVRRAGDSGKYCLSLKLLELSGRLTDNIDVLDAARPYLERLRDRAQETVHLVVRDGSDIVYVFKAESRSSAYRMFSRIGIRRAMYCTAAGKSMLAAMPDHEVERIWRASDVRPYTEHTILTLDALMDELDEVRRRGYALDNEENEPGVRCIASALTDFSGGSNSAFSISAPAIRMSDERIAELAPGVLAACAQISAELGYRAT